MNLMLDEGANDPKIVEALNKLRDFNAVCCLDCGFRRGQGDNVLVHQKKNTRILLSKNSHDMNESNYPPGSHNGLISFSKQELTPNYVVTRLKAMLALSWVHRAKNNVVIIQDEDIALHTQSGSEKEVFRKNAKTKRFFQRARPIRRRRKANSKSAKK